MFPSHDHKQSIQSHLKYGCAECGRIPLFQSRRLTTEQFIEKSNEIYDYKYNYDLCVYKHSREPVKIICPLHGEFEQKPFHHLQGHQCQKCSSIGSKAQSEIVDFVKSYNFSVLENYKEIIPPKELDIYIPSLNFAIEYNGLYWHSLRS